MAARARDREGQEPARQRCDHAGGAFVIWVAATRRDAEALVTETAHVLRPLGLTLSKEKTRITHIDEGLDFLGWSIKRDRGRRGRPGSFLFPSKAALASVKAKVKEITRSGTNQSLDRLLHRLNPVLRGWCAYFRSGQCSRTFQYLGQYTWRRVAGWRRKYPRRNWRWLRRHHLPGWWRTDRETALYNPAAASTTRYRYRAARIETPRQSGRIASRDATAYSSNCNSSQMTTGGRLPRPSRWSTISTRGWRRWSASCARSPAPTAGSACWSRSPASASFSG
jgi:RNA-directed DNA polymerase